MDKKIFALIFLILLIALVYTSTENDGHVYIQKRNLAPLYAGGGPRSFFTLDETIEATKKLGLNLKGDSLLRFHKGMNNELEHGTISPHTNITDDCPIKTAKIVLCHLEKKPTCY